jgi:branched-chain amino acid transport system permease protein
MGDVAAFLIAGLGVGGVYCLLGLGIVTLYRSTGVLNFAFAAMGMVAVFGYVELAERGVEPWVAALLMVVAGIAFGVLAEVILMRRFRQEPPTTKAVATIAMLVGLIGLVDTIWGTTPREIPTWLPQWSASVGDTRISGEKLTTLAVAIVAVAGLGLLFTRTRTGVALRAMASDRETSALVGVPVGRLTVLGWALTGGMAALSLLLVAPSRGLSSGSLSLLVIPGLAAAVIGNLRSPAGVVAGGLALGIVESEAGLSAWTAENSLVVPFVVLLVVLLWRQRKVLIPAFDEGGRA